MYAILQSNENGPPQQKQEWREKSTAKMAKKNSFQRCNTDGK